MLQIFAVPDRSIGAAHNCADAFRSLTFAAAVRRRVRTAKNTLQPAICSGPASWNELGWKDDQSLCP